VWRMATQAGPASLPLAPRALEAAGFVLLALWSWRRASASVRTRIVAAFIGVLGAAVIVMGGAAARVSVTNAIDNAQSRLESAVRSEQELLSSRATDLLNRAALGSAVVTQLGPNAQTIASLRRQAFPDADLLWFISEKTFDVVGTTANQNGWAGIKPSLPVAAARGGRAATGVVEGQRVAGEDQLVSVPDACVIVAAQPVFRAGAGRTRRDVVGILLAGFQLDRGELVSIAQRTGPEVGAELVGLNGAIVRSKNSLPRVSTHFGSPAEPSGRKRLDGVDELIVVAPLTRVTEAPPTALALVLPVSVAADVATAFPRALVGGVLVAALLAVVLALWLASRITRPILSLADEAERVKSDFLATVSHELRTPLTPIRGYADLLRRGRVPRRRAVVYLDEIDVAARRMERIVTLLVEVAAMEAGRYTLETEPLAPADLLSEAADRWRDQSPAHTFVVRAAKSIPRVQADKRAISAVLGELLDNAVKFSPKGGTIELTARRTGEGVELAVADEGIGLEPDTFERLSAAFVQAEPGETRRFGGLGLGLTFAAGVLAAHGSRLDVAGTNGSGAAFSFTLPSIVMVSRLPGGSKRNDEVKR
jgi:signal transduction histidine kinase